MITPRTLLLLLSLAVLAVAACSGDLPASSTTGAAGGAGGAGGSGGAAGAGQGGEGAGSDCSEDPCKLIPPQCGCAEGEQCNLAPVSSVSEGRACGAEGTTTAGDACSDTALCEPGAGCFELGGFDRCFRVCESDTECLGPVSICAIPVTDADYPGISLCSDLCDPVSNAGCTVPGTGCSLEREPAGLTRWYVVCNAAGIAMQGEACLTSADCAATYGCLNDTCSKYCAVGGEDVCAASGTTCMPTGVFVGVTEIGGCL